MTFTIRTLAQSLALYLAPILPGVQMLEDPVQQGVEPPCMFLQQRDFEIHSQLDNRFRRTIRLDLTFLLQKNLPDLHQQYLAAVEALDLCMETFPYTDGSGTVLLRTYDRRASIDSDGAHYKFELRVFVDKTDDSVLLQDMQMNLRSK